MKVAVKMIKNAKEKDRREYFYRQWLMVFPNMTKENFVGFEEYYQDRVAPKIDMRATEEIMSEILGG